MFICSTYDPVEAIVTPEKAGRVYNMKQSQYGIWVAFKKSVNLINLIFFLILCHYSCSLVSLYDTEHFVELMSIDFTTLLPQELGGKVSQTRMLLIMAFLYTHFMCILGISS